MRRAVESVNRALGPGVSGIDAADQQRARRRAPRARRDTGSRTPRRERRAGCLGRERGRCGCGTGASPVSLAAGGADPLLPMPMVNVISGGAHARGAGVDVQDFLVVPVGATTFAEAVEWSWRVRRGTEELARERGLAASLVADEGGLGLALASNRAGLELLLAGIERAGLTPGDDVAIAVDIAATQLLTAAGYRLEAEDRVLDAGELTDELEGWCSDFPIVSLEDPVGEDDWEGWRGDHASPGRPDSASRRRPVRHEPGATRARRGRARRERRARQAESDRDALRSARGCRARSVRGLRHRRSLPARATRRTAGSPISPSAGGQARSRSARRCAPKERRSGTACSGSRPNSVTRPCSRGGAHRRASAPT